jgi:hypothetical protein
MNNIIRFALMREFNNNEILVKNLLEVINATPNPEVAAEKVLCIYTRPKLYRNACIEDKPNAEMLSFSPLANAHDVITYQYNYTITKWFKTTDEVQEPWGEGKAYKTETNCFMRYVVETRKSTCSLSTWLKKQYEHNEFDLYDHNTHSFPVLLCDMCEEILPAEYDYERNNH